MSRGERAVLGIVLMAGGLLGLLIYVAWFTMWVYPMFPTAHMMGGWNYGELEELTGKVEKIGWMEIELRVNGKIVEVHGPLWFWQRIGVKEGDTVVVKGVFVLMREHGETLHEGFIPFELRVNGRTYGDTDSRTPVWMQG